MQYYFNLYNDEITQDYEGLELADDDAARDHGLNEARAMAAQSVREGYLTASHYIEVVDANRDSVATIRFDEAVELRP